MSRSRLLCPTLLLWHSPPVAAKHRSAMSPCYVARPMTQVELYAGGEALSTFFAETQQEMLERWSWSCRGWCCLQRCLCISHCEMMVVYFTLWYIGEGCGRGGVYAGRGELIFPDLCASPCIIAWDPPLAHARVRLQGCTRVTHTWGMTLHWVTKNRTHT